MPHGARRVRSGWPDAAIGAALAAVAAALYLPRLLPGTGFSADTMKYHYIGAVFGISHPPGSPLYILVNGLVARVPFGELAWRLNLLSAVCAAVAALFLYLLARQLSGSRTMSAIAAAALLAAGMFWEQSVVAEVYTPHAALLVAACWLLLRWHHDGAARDIAIAAALYGLSFGVHVMSWFLLPGWIALALVGRRPLMRQPREAMLVAAGALLGVSTYLYYAIRPAMRPVYVEFPIDSAGAFLDFVTGSYFRRYMFAYDARTMWTERLPWLIDLALANAGVPLLALALAGLVVIARDDRRLFTALAAAVLLSCLYAMGYSVPDAHVYALPALYVLLAAAAAGGVAVARAARRVTARSWLPAATLAALAIAVAVERRDDVARNAVQIDRSRDTRLATYAERIFATVDERSTIVAGSDPTFHALAYYSWGLGRGRESGVVVRSHSPSECEDALAAIREYSMRGPVYATTELTSCVTGAGYDVEAWDFSRTLPEYLAAQPPGRLVLVAVHDEGTAGIDAPTWDRLETLGVLTGMRDRYRWSHAAVLVRTSNGFTGVSESREAGVEIVLARGNRISDGYDAPVDLAVGSGGQLSGRPAALVADGVDYARPRRGLQIVVLDAATGTPVERQAFDTHRTISLRELDFLRIVGAGPR
jgi:hypothetical protein